jgi:hypothetical protein
MKKQRIFLFAFLAILTSTAPILSQNKTSADSTSTLGKIWNKLTGPAPFTQNDLTGKWNYKSTACKFETDNLLKKAGGAIVATQVESAFDEYCQKMGIKEGNAHFTFNKDSTYAAKLGVLKFSGKCKLNDDTKMMSMTYALGIGKTNALVVKLGNKMKLYFDADSFLKMMKTLSMFTNNNKVEILAKMAELYDGMLLGFEMEKE